MRRIRQRFLEVRLGEALVASQVGRGATFDGILDATAGDDVPIPVRGRVLDVVIGEGDYDQLTLTLSDVYYMGEWRPLDTETLRLRRERKKGRGWLSSALLIGAAAGDGIGGGGCRRGAAVGTGVQAGLTGLGFLLADRGQLELAEGDVLAFVVAGNLP